MDVKYDQIPKQFKKSLNDTHLNLTLFWAPESGSKFLSNVADPDPYDLGHPGSGTVSQWYPTDPDPSINKQK